MNFRVFQYDDRFRMNPILKYKFRAINLHNYTFYRDTTRELHYEIARRIL